MNSAIEPCFFTIPLALEAHSKAEGFFRQHLNPRKAKQVYLNTLAVYAVNLYLQYLGLETDLEASDSYNPVMRSLMDVADLEVKDLGKIECRPLLPDSDFLYVPAEVWEERIGYIAVQLDQSLRQANLLGFAAAVATEQLPLSQLQSLEDLPEHFNQIRQPVKMPVNLSQWLNDIFEAGWQEVEKALFRTPETNLAFRAKEKRVQRTKLIDLNNGESVQLVVTLIANQEQESEILVNLQPSAGQTYLPANVQMLLLDLEGNEILKAVTGTENQNIELEFSGETGDSFQIAIVGSEFRMTEDFVV